MLHSRSTRHRISCGFAAIPALAMVACALVGLPMVGQSSATAAPEPSPIPKRWQLDIEPSVLRMISIQTEKGPKAYYYMTYKVTNNSTMDLLFAPVFELATNEQQILRSGRDVPVAVTNELLQRLQNPFLQDQISIVDTLLRGEENAREGLVVWPVPSDHLNEIAVYAAGFSGETATIESTGKDGEVEKKVLRKTLMLRYRMPGDLDTSKHTEFQPHEVRWIMR
jgi:hypothetical protein